jgi:hypothetical protein
MRKAILTTGLSLLLSTFLSAQTEVEKKLKDEIWKNASAEFNVVEVPEKWKNESAVILALKREYVGDLATKMTGLNVNRFYVEKISIHFRIKLLDKAAVEEFSELSFDNKKIKTNLFGRSSTYHVVGIKVIKPNGSEKEVDLSNAVKSDAGSNKDLKIPIPNLVMGDILDYFIALKDESMSMPNFGDEDLLEQSYPVVSNTISFKIPEQFNMYTETFNGAPSFKKEKQERDLIYTLKDEMRDKAPDLIWNFDYRTAPHIRYKISSDFKKPDMKLSAENVLDSYQFNTSNIGFIEDFMNGNFKKEKDPQKLVYELCYLLNNPIYKKAYFNIPQGDPIRSNYTPDLYFLLINKYLIKHKIDHEVMIVSNRQYGKFADLVSLSACDFMIKVKTDPPIYIPRPSAFTIPNEIPYVFQDMEAVTKSFVGHETARDKTLGSTTMEENSTTTKLVLSLVEDDNTKVNVKRDITVKGKSKSYHQYMVFTNYDYLKEYDLPKYQVESSRLLGELIGDYNKEKKKFEQRQAQDYNERDARVKDYLEHEMDLKVSEYKKISVSSIGMWHHSPETKYDDEFTVENLSKKAGPNLIISMGKVIEKQTLVKDEDKIRTRDVYMVFPRMFSYDISLTVPEGYTVEGLENFNKKVENELGGFVSNATLQGNVINIKTKKYYTTDYCKGEAWPKIVAYLDAALEFYNTKLLLKKQ